MRFLYRFLFVAYAALFAAAADIRTADAQGAASGHSLQYTVRVNDTLWLIATMYYSAPRAYMAIYAENKAAFDDAYSHAQQSSSFDAKLHPRGPDSIFAGTVIELPAEIESNGIDYVRRALPMDPSRAQVFAKKGGITLDELTSATRSMLPPSLKVDPGAPPARGYVKIDPAAPGAKREPPPTWLAEASKSGGVPGCAAAVCRRYSQLCYFECLIIAKRLGDGEVSCQPVPDSLPYELDEANRDCAELLQ